MNKKLVLVVALALLMVVMTGCTPTKVESKAVARVMQIGGEWK